MHPDDDPADDAATGELPSTPGAAERGRPVQAGRRALGGLLTRVRGLDDRTRSTDFVPAAETVVLDVRRHWMLLALPATRTALGLVALLTGSDLLWLALFALAVLAWAHERLHAPLRRLLTIAAGTALGLVLLSGLAGPLTAALALLLWAVEDVADWWCDRLVVTDKRIYRRYGVLTRHAPSISLTAVAYIDPAEPPLGRALGYGTLRLDSVAQRDAPLSRFDLVPGVEGVSKEILRLRALAMPKWPQQPA